MNPGPSNPKNMPVIQNSATFVLDNGAATLKCGFSNSPAARIIPNCITKAKSEKRRAFIGDQIDDCRDLSSLFYMLPFQKGYLVNWDHQKTVWDYVFGKNCLNFSPSSKSLIFTEPYFNFNSIQEGLNELLFEDYKFQSVLRTNPADLACYKNKLDHPEESCCLIVDSGYSFTHVIPFINGKRIRKNVLRIDVGGKLLTNHLKEIISYRQLHVLDETYAMNACKEDCCYVSLDFQEDMKNARLPPGKNTVARDYVLPDFTTLRRGYMKSAEDSTGRPSEGEQIIRMNNERFQVPELLFNPSDIGIQQMGIPEAIHDVVSKCPEETHRWLYQNIVLVGGCSLFPNFRKRVEKDVREIAPAQYKVNVTLPNNPINYAWEGGVSLSYDEVFKSISVSRLEFLEKGHQICEETFYI